MAAPLDTITGFAVGNPKLQERFEAARLQTAWNIVAEDPATANHANRLAWAKKIFADLKADTGKEYRWALSHALIQTNGVSITDAQMVTVAGSFVDAWST